MASCVKKKSDHPMHDGDDNDDDEDDDDQGHHGDNHFRMSVSPNPVLGNEIVLTVRSEKNAKAELILIDAYSRIALRKPVRLVDGENRISVDISRLMKGFSSIVLSFPSGKRETVKFIRLRFAKTRKDLHSGLSIWERCGNSLGMQGCKAANPN